MKKDSYIKIFFKKLRDFFLSFFMSKDKPQPSYFWATVFNSLAAWALYKHIKYTTKISVELISVVFAYVAGWIIIYFKTKTPPTV